jgi:hypothetical protein
MSYTKIITPGSFVAEGRFNVKFTPDRLISLGLIIDLQSRYLPGSILYLREEWSSQFVVTDEKAIDVDFRYFDPELYLGTWQELDYDTSLWEGDHDKAGKINSLTHTISKVTPYTIVSFGTTPEIAGTGRIDNCNFLTVQSPRVINGTSRVTNTPVGYDAIFSTEFSRTKAKFISQTITANIGNIGYFLNPGVQLTGITYKASVDPTLIYESTTFGTGLKCTLPVFSPLACSAEFTAFLAQTSSRFATLAECQLNSGAIPCLQKTFFCADGGTRTYYQSQQI